MGLFIIVLLVIGTVLLIRNMNKRLRRLPDEFPGSRGRPAARRSWPGSRPTSPPRTPPIPARPAADSVRTQVDQAKGSRVRGTGPPGRTHGCAEADGRQDVRE